MPSVTKEFFRARNALPLLSRSLFTIETFHGVTGNTLRLESGLSRFDSQRATAFFSMLIFSFRDIPGGGGSDAERDRDMCSRDKPGGGGGWIPKTPMSRVTSFTDAPY